MTPPQGDEKSQSNPSTTRKDHKPLFNRVLIANDSLDGMEVALTKAALVEHFSGASVKALEVIYDTVAEEPDRLISAADRANLIEAFKAAERKGLNRLLEPLQDKVADLEGQIAWSKSCASAIVRELDGVDLLIKPISRHQSLLDRLHAPLDWALMRTAPCPVLISKQTWADSGVVLAALDAGDDAHEDLNRAILRTAADLAEILGCELQLVSAYPALGQSVGELQVAMDYEGIKADMRASRTALIDGLVAELGIDVTEVHLLEGHAREAIPELSNRMGAVVTVLGTSARRGLSQLMLGNTAEAIIGALEGDLVTIRFGAD